MEPTATRHQCAQFKSAQRLHETHRTLARHKSEEYNLRMDNAIILAGLLSLIGGPILLGWFAWRLFKRGCRDHLWILAEAHKASFFITFVLLLNGLGRLLSDGITPDTVYWLGLAAIALPIPYAFYITGRCAGIWQRSRRSPLPNQSD